MVPKIGVDLVPLAPIGPHHLLGRVLDRLGDPAPVALPLRHADVQTRPLLGAHPHRPRVAGPAADDRVLGLGPRGRGSELALDEGEALLADVHEQPPLERRKARLGRGGLDEGPGQARLGLGLGLDFGLCVKALNVIPGEGGRGLGRAGVGLRGRNPVSRARRGPTRGQGQSETEQRASGRGVVHVHGLPAALRTSPAPLFPPPRSGVAVRSLQVTPALCLRSRPGREMTTARMLAGVGTPGLGPRSGTPPQRPTTAACETRNEFQI